MAEAAKEQRPEILLITENKTVILRDGARRQILRQVKRLGGGQSDPRGRRKS